MFIIILHKIVNLCLQQPAFHINYYLRFFFMIPSHDS